MKKILIPLSLVIIFGLLFGLLLRQSLNKQNPKIAIKNSRLTITTSFYPLFFFTKKITGDNADVVNITPAGSEPHDYELTPKNIIQIQKSNLLIVLGESFEPWLVKIAPDLESGKVTILYAGDERIKKDPHIWLSPVLAKEIVNNITAKLVFLDPQKAEEYKKNAGDLLNQLIALGIKYREELKGCKLKDIVTSHAAFNYFADDYGLNQISIAGLSPDEEPSPTRLAEIAKIVKDKGIKYIFFESLVSPKLAQTIATETGAGTLVLNPLEGLTSQEADAGKDYLSLMNENLQSLRIALECQ